MTANRDIPSPAERKAPRGLRVELSRASGLQKAADISTKGSTPGRNARLVLRHLLIFEGLLVPSDFIKNVDEERGLG